MPDDFSDVPEADALEQRLEVGGEEESGAPGIGLETPEADALEQSQAVPLDDGYDSRA
jgi:hypothetical protein